MIRDSSKDIVSVMLSQKRTSKWKSMSDNIVELLNNMRAYYSHLGGLERSMFIQVN